tara:strand:- start:2486 stop:3259 length:774 start_codon:yes stop_codon:yes gene_type:complete
MPNVIPSKKDNVILKPGDPDPNIISRLMPTRKNSMSPETYSNLKGLGTLTRKFDPSSLTGSRMEYSKPSTVIDDESAKILTEGIQDFGSKLATGVSGGNTTPNQEIYNSQPTETKSDFATAKDEGKAARQQLRNQFKEEKLRARLQNRANRKAKRNPEFNAGALTKVGLNHEFNGPTDMQINTVGMDPYGSPGQDFSEGEKAASNAIFDSQINREASINTTGAFAKLSKAQSETFDADGNGILTASDFKAKSEENNN